MRETEIEIYTCIEKVIKKRLNLKNQISFYVNLTINNRVKGEATLCEGVPECFGKGRGTSVTNFVVAELQHLQRKIGAEK